MIRVATLNRARDAFPGGDLIQIDSLTAALKPLGVERVEEDGYTIHQRKYHYDLIHIHHMNFGWSRVNFEGAFKCGLPVVVTPIFYQLETFGMSFVEMGEWLSKCACIYPHSTVEEREILKRVKYSGKVEYIPNGTDERFHAADGGDREGVLCVAARAGDKNTGLVEVVCTELGIPFTLACGVVHNSMPSMYRGHRVFVNASGKESMSITTAEALCSGCRVLDTVNNWGNTWYPRLQTIDPTDDFTNHLKWAYEVGEWDYSPNAAARRITWNKVAEMQAAAYRKVLL